MEEAKGTREMEIKLMEKVGDVIAHVGNAKQADQVITALHALAVLLFPVDSRSLLGSIDELYRDEVIGHQVSAANERSQLWKIFYKGAAFPALARVLLHGIASDWLSCFPTSARRHVYDVFFVDGCSTEVVQMVVPCLQHRATDSHEADAVSLNAERLLVLCLVENQGVLKMFREFSVSCQHGDINNEKLKRDTCMVAQLVASIPDKARMRASASLSPHLFFKHVTNQLLAGAEEWGENSHNEISNSNKNNLDGPILLIGEAFSRMCRRGSAEVLLNEVIPQILAHVQGFLLLSSDMTVDEALKLNFSCRFWLKIVESMRDPYSVERMSEQLLNQLAAQRASDLEAYWILWVLFHQVYKQQASIRLRHIQTRSSMMDDIKVFPLVYFSP